MEFLLYLIAFVHTGMALKCFNCNNQANPACGPYFKPYQFKADICPHHVLKCALQRQTSGGSSIYFRENGGISASKFTMYTDEHVQHITLLCPACLRYAKEKMHLMFTRLYEKTSHDGWIGIRRICYDPGSLPGINETNGCRHWTNDDLGYTAFYCFCDSDYCNSTRKINDSNTTAVLLTTLSLVFNYLTINIYN